MVITMLTDKEIWEKAVSVWETGAKALQKLSREVSPAAIAQCVRMLAECRGRIITSGVGTSAAAARKIAHSLSCIERPSFFLSPADAVHGGLGTVQPGDVAILISKGGGTQELLALVPALKTKQVAIIGVTEHGESPLARASDLLLKVRVDKEADEFNMLATTSTIAVIAVFDAVAIALMRYTGYTRGQFAVIHPGGAVGERLLGKRP